MSIRQSYSKLFYDLEKAKTFGLEVDKAADESTVQTGKRTFTSIFAVTNPLYQDNYEVTGKFYYILKEKGANNRDRYYVQYDTLPVKGALRADLIQAKQKADGYLKQKYQEFEPNAGRSLG